MAKLNLGILGIYEKSEQFLSEEGLSELALEVLATHPLEEILELSNVELKQIGSDRDHSQEKEEIRYFENKSGSDVIAIVRNKIWVHYDKRTGIIYSDVNSTHLSHEIGHKLGLEHPTHSCGQFCDRYYAENKCSFSREIMGCAGALGETTGFSELDIKTLKEKYLR